MNHVWSAIAFRAPCAARQAQQHRQPLLQLFNGYARSSATKTSQTRTRIHDEKLHAHTNTSLSRHAAFSTTAILTARHRPSHNRAPKSNPRILSDSRLEPAPTIASHTEGLPPEFSQGEELTWRDYDPLGGMPLPGGERSQATVNSIFSNEDVDKDTGNYILSVMYWRRQSGALIDTGLTFPKDSGVSREQAARALVYVRNLAPDFDEHAAGNVWAEEESLRLQEELRDRAVKLRLYKSDDPDPAPEEEVEDEEDQGTEYGRSRNKDSSLLRLRRENEARSAKQEADRLAAEQKAELTALASHRGPLELAGGVQPSIELVTYTGPGGVTISRPRTEAWLQPVERKPWVKYYEERAQLIRENSIPQLSLFRRLLPSFLTLSAILALALFVQENYTPAPRSARFFPDTPPAVATLGALTATLATFFLLGRVPPLWRTMSKYFTLVPAYPYSISLIGSIFRHDTLLHLSTSIAALWILGLTLHQDVGRGAFLGTFFSCGAIGSFASLTNLVLRRQLTVYVFGASAAVLGVLAAACTLRPNGTIKIAGMDVPIAAWVFLALYAGGEVWAVVRGRKGPIDHVGHVAGMLAGVGAAVLVQRRAVSSGETIAEEQMMAIPNVDDEEGAVEKMGTGIVT